MRMAAIVVGLAIVCVWVPAAASAKLPHPKTTVIAPGRSIAGVKLDMTKTQVFHQWGSTGCSFDVCEWSGPGAAGHTERARVSFFNNKVIQITINAATTGTNLKFKPGVLSTWKTSKQIALGSSKASVERAYPKATPNTSEGVLGFDLFAGSRPDLRYTRFSTPGIGATPTRLRYIQLAWDSCHYIKC